MSEPPIHRSHVAIIQRLKRAEGHLRTITQMMEKERSCLDIAQQLHAVEKAVSAAKKALIHDHIDHCLDAMSPGKPSKSDRDSMQEFKEITKYL
jgi:DNA-binding FrmR family transcriptional regulator